MNTANKISSGNANYRSTVVGCTRPPFRPRSYHRFKLEFVLNTTSSWIYIPVQSLGRRKLQVMPQRTANIDSFLFPDTSRRI